MKIKAIPRLRPALDQAQLETTLEAAKGGDEGALASLMKTLSETLVLRVRRRWCRDFGEARCIVQDAWVAAWHRIEAFNDIEHLRQWLHVVVRNKAISRLRQENARQAAHARLRAKARTSGASARLSIDPEVFEEEWPSDSVFSKLSSRQRTVVTLFYGLDRSVEEVAILVGCSKGAVKTALYRARITLSSLLDDG